MLGLGVGLTTNSIFGNKYATNTQQIHNWAKIRYHTRTDGRNKYNYGKKCLLFGFVGSLKYSFSVIVSVFLLATAERDNTLSRKPCKNNFIAMIF